MILGAIQVVTDHRPTLGEFDALFNEATAAKLAATAAVAIVLLCLLLAPILAYQRMQTRDLTGQR